jgi:thiamine-monophosphate kinase
VWTTGTIGDGALGLMAARGELGPLTAEARNLLVSRYRVPEPPKLAFADVVAAHANSAIDVSDGLVADAGHVAHVSGVRVVIEAAAAPLSAAGAHYVANGKVGLGALLTGGDDYQTLFTAPPRARESVMADAAAVGVAVARIGRVEAGAGVRLLDAAGAEMALGAGGWTHF